MVMPRDSVLHGATGSTWENIYGARNCIMVHASQVPSLLYSNSGLYIYVFKKNLVFQELIAWYIKKK